MYERTRISTAPHQNAEPPHATHSDMVQSAPETASKNARETTDRKPV
ncbi:hypothetical protein [Azospirillum thiophilum]|nr:hypothetical protein [Azospirillum thiophilum]